MCRVFGNIRKQCNLNASHLETADSLTKLLAARRRSRMPRANKTFLHGSNYEFTPFSSNTQKKKKQAEVPTSNQHLPHQKM